MISRTNTFLAIAFAGALIALPTNTSAQSTWDLTFGAGISNPKGDFNSAWDIGVNANVAGTYWFQDRIGFRLETAVDVLSGENFGGNASFPTGAPDLNLWHFGGGLEYSVTDRDSDALSVIVNGGGGLTWLDSDDFGTDGGFVTTESLSEVAPHLNGGLSVGWPLSDDLTIAVNGSLYVTFPDEDDIGAIPGVGAFDQAVTFPVGLTLRFHL